MSVGDATQSDLDRLQFRALIAAVGGLAGSAGAALLWRGAFFQAYLVSYLFWVGIALGSISLLLLHNLTGGKWGLLIRRPLEAGAMVIVPMAVLFAPILLGMRDLYPWTIAEVVAANPSVKHKAAYLNENAFLIRAGVMFLLWTVLASLLHFGAIRRDGGGTGDGTESTRAGWLPKISGPGLALVFFTGSFAAIDWMMSREPAWYSTIYGPMVIVGWGLLTFATMILTAGWLSAVSPAYASAATPTRVQDLGNLMLAFVMLWAYMSFSQFLIIWSGNLTEEIPWYLRRTRGGWQYVALALVGFHFFVPFFALLFRDIKRNVRLLMFVAGAVVAMHIVDLSWLVLPAPMDEGGSRPAIPWGSVLLIPVTWAGIGGVAVWSFLWNLRRRPLVPDELLAAKPDAHDHGS